jgi:hypothetical protein
MLRSTETKGGERALETIKYPVIPECWIWMPILLARPTRSQELQHLTIHYHGYGRKIELKREIIA